MTGNLFDTPSPIRLDGFPVDEGGVSESGIGDRQVAIVKDKAVSQCDIFSTREPQMGKRGSPVVIIIEGTAL
jgi:hypothetical protein